MRGEEVVAVDTTKRALAEQFRRFRRSLRTWVHRGPDSCRIKSNARTRLQNKSERTNQIDFVVTLCKQGVAVSNSVTSTRFLFHSQKSSWNDMLLAIRRQRRCSTAAHCRAADRAIGRGSARQTDSLTAISLLRLDDDEASL